MQLEQKMEQSEALLEVNEQNKQKLEEAQRQVRQAGNRANLAVARAQQCQDRLQQAIAARNAAQQQAAQEENGTVPASYDAEVARAEAELHAADMELQESRRELMEASERQRVAEGDLAESTGALRNAAAELQQVSEKYGVAMGKTRQLMSLSHSEIASPLLEQLGMGKDNLDDLRRRIAASLGISLPGGSAGGYGGGGSGGGRGVRGRILSRSGTNTIYPNSGGGGVANTYSLNTGASQGAGAAKGNGSGYVSPYVKTEYSGEVTYTDPQTKQRVTKVSNRTVYQNRNLDPNMVIPAGTRYANGRRVWRNTTNMELMRQGKAPFVLQQMPDGSTVLAQLELHHADGMESHPGSRYFSGTDRDGTMVEISHLTHDKYNRQLHLGNPSFRRGRRKEKTADAAKYDSFRRSYWKSRAKSFESQS